MKKHAIVLVMCLLMAGISQAQDRRGFVGLGLGASFPNGDFGSTGDAQTAAHAQTGGFIDFHIGYKFTEVLGVMGMVRGQVNQFDEAAYGAGETVEADPWVTTSYLVGPFASFPLGPENKVAFESRGLIGYASSRFPEIEYGTGAGKITYPTENAGSFAYLIGLGLRLNPGDRFTLALHVDYFSTKPKFDADGLPGTTATYKQPIQNINLGLSFGYRFL